MNNQLRSFYEEKSIFIVHLFFCHKDLSLELLRCLKFTFYLSNFFLFYLSPSNFVNFNSEDITAIEFLFFYSLNENKNKKTIAFCCVSNNINDFSEKVTLKMEDIWNKCLKKFDIGKDYLMKDYFDLEFYSDMNLYVENKQNSLSLTNDFGSMNINIFSEYENCLEFFSKLWIKSKNFAKKFLLSISNEEIKDCVSFYFIDFAFYQVSEISLIILKKWNKFIQKGKTLENYGKLASDFLKITEQKFDDLIPLEINKNPILVEKKQKIRSFLVKKISSLFTKQLLNLQTQALEKFKEMLDKVISEPKKPFDTERQKIIEYINEWFSLHAKLLLSKDVDLSYLAAKRELNNVLLDFSEKYKDSPAAKIKAMQRIEKQTSTSGLRQNGIVVGFGLTAAYRPSGFGNFQLVSSYTQGPHVFNFSLVNDKDVAEQEGQGKIKTFRVQPSLNFDIEL